jgi:hypothetical protein
MGFGLARFGNQSGWWDLGFRFERLQVNQKAADQAKTNGGAGPVASF